MIIEDPKRLKALARHLYTLALADDMPVVAHLDVTYRCDLDCEHCYLSDKQWPELNTAELRSVIGQLRELGVIRVVWSGGEVFARPDFLELVQLAGRKGIVSNVKTHAGNLTEARAAALAASGVFRIDVSIYSLREEVHDAVTRVPGSLRASLQGIDNALAAGMAVRVAIVLFRSNHEEIEALDAHFRAKGCQVHFSSTILTDHKASSHLDRLRLTPAEMAAAAVQVLALKVAGGGAYEPHALVEEHGPCGAARTGLYVAPDGHVWPCVTFPLSLGNLREQSLAEIWAQSAVRKELLAFSNRDRHTCNSCAGSDSCAYCMGEAFSRTGDFRQAPPTFHIETRARMEAAAALGLRTYTAADWRSVPLPDLPDGQAPANPDKKFVFPIHQPQKGRGRRAHEVPPRPGCAGGCADG